MFLFATFVVTRVWIVVDYVMLSGDVITFEFQSLRRAERPVCKGSTSTERDYVHDVLGRLYEGSSKHNLIKHKVCV